MIRITKADDRAEKELLESMRSRASEVGEKINAAAAKIMEDVRVNGYEAVRKYSLQFDGAEPYEISAEQLERPKKNATPLFWKR